MEENNLTLELIEQIKEVIVEVREMINDGKIVEANITLGLLIDMLK